MKNDVMDDRAGYLRWTFFVFVFVFLVYIFFLPHGGQNSDSYWYLESISHGEIPSLFHPHHLLFNFTGRLYWNFLTQAGFRGNSMQALQIMTAFSGALGAAGFFVFLLQATRDKYASLCASLLFVFSYSYWYYAVIFEVYGLSTFFLILFLLAFSYFQGKRNIFLLIPGILMGVSILYHQINFLMVLPAALTLLFSLENKRPLSERLFRAFLFCLTAGIVTLSTYTLVGFLLVDVGSWKGLLYWMTGYVQSGGYTEGWHLMSLPKEIVGQARGLLHSGQLALEFVQEKPSYRLLFLNAIPTLLAGSLLIGLSTRMVRRGVGLLYKTYPQMFTFFLISYLVEAFFFMWYEPSNVEFSFFRLLPLCGILGLFLALPEVQETDKPRNLILAGFLVLVIFLGNLSQDIFLLRDPNNDPYLVAGKMLGENMVHGDFALVPGIVFSRADYLWQEKGKEKEFLNVDKAIKNNGRNMGAGFLYLKGHIKKTLQSGHRFFFTEKQISFEHIRQFPGIDKEVEIFFAPYRKVSKKVGSIRIPWDDGVFGALTPMVDIPVYVVDVLPPETRE